MPYFMILIYAMTLLLLFFKGASFDKHINQATLGILWLTQILIKDYWKNSSKEKRNFWD